jgi:hypothetical protein
MPTGGGGGDAAPADSGADASVRLAGRTARTRLNKYKSISRQFFPSIPSPSGSYKICLIRLFE